MANLFLGRFQGHWFSAATWANTAANFLVPQVVAANLDDRIGKAGGRDTAACREDCESSPHQIDSRTLADTPARRGNHCYVLLCEHNSCRIRSFFAILS